MPLGEKYFSTQPRWKQRAVLFVCVRHGRSLFKFLPLFIAVSVSDSDQDFGPRLLIGDERTERTRSAGALAILGVDGASFQTRREKNVCTGLCKEVVKQCFAQRR